MSANPHWQPEQLSRTELLAEAAAAYRRAREILNRAQLRPLTPAQATEADRWQDRGKELAGRADALHERQAGT